MSRIPREAREAAMRAWLEILRQRHPHVTWVPVQEEQLHDPAAQAEARSTSVTSA
jgi:hypothetical protein